MINAGQFFATARERYQIKERRDAGCPRPWTTDRIFATWRFCHVHRENDRTTQWFARHIRNPLNKRGDKIKMAQAATIFRWFNRVETGEKIKDLLLGRWDTEEARRRLRHVAPIVTGAYIIKGPDGYNKLNGVLLCIDKAIPDLERKTNTWGCSLAEAWKDINELFYLGPFMSYEVISDLRWTPILEQADDIHTWAHAGPGCARGLGWVFHDMPSVYNYCARRDQLVMLEKMCELLEMSRSKEYWPTEWRPWEMREVEHWCCEYDKYKRAELGFNLKRRYT